MRKKGTPKTGGRKKGTPNKSTSELKIWINNLIDSNRDSLENDLKKLDPVERWKIIEKLMSYVIPKKQSLSVEAQIQAEYNELERLLEKAPDEVLEKIIERIETIKNMQDE